jgi:hypothetical protein
VLHEVHGMDVVESAINRDLILLDTGDQVYAVHPVAAPPEEFQRPVVLLHITLHVLGALLCCHDDAFFLL